MAQSIQASLGKIIMREKAMGSKFIRIKASTEDIGLQICKMVKEFSSSLIAKSIQVNGKKVFVMVMENTNVLGKFLKVSGSTISNKGSDGTDGKTRNTKDFMISQRRMGSVNIDCLMDQYILGISRTIKSRVKGC